MRARAPWKWFGGVIDTYQRNAMSATRLNPPTVWACGLSSSKRAEKDQKHPCPTHTYKAARTSTAHGHSPALGTHLPRARATRPAVHVKCPAQPPAHTTKRPPFAKLRPKKFTFRSNTYWGQNWLFSLNHVAVVYPSYSPCSRCLFGANLDFRCQVAGIQVS